MVPSRPEEDPVNFLPRIRIPVLMLSGKYDSGFPLELSQKPFFRLLGSPADDEAARARGGGPFSAAANDGARKHWPGWTSISGLVQRR